MWEVTVTVDVKKKKKSYEHVSISEWLPRYRRFGSANTKAL